MDYQIRNNPRAKKLTLRLNKEGQLMVTAPRLMPKFLIDKFVKSQTAWIESNQQKISKIKNKFINDRLVTLFGKKYARQNKVIDGPSGVKIQKDQILINLHGSQSASKSKQVLEKFLKNTATHYITPKTHQLAKKMSVNFNKLGFRAQTTRWGSCSSAGNLSFNWKLVHFLPAVIDYVIVHELAHLEHLDHSRQFWSLVEKYSPEYKLHRGWLKRQGIGVG